MNQRSMRSSVVSTVLLVLVLPVLAACGASGYAASPGLGGPVVQATTAPGTSTNTSPATGAVSSPVTTTVGSPVAAVAASGLNEINHIVVIYQENWSFDSLYPDFPSANGSAAAAAGASPALGQVDKNGQRLTVLPQPKDTSKKPAVPDARFPANLPVQPYDLAKYVLPTDKIGDLPGGFYQEQQQIDGGKMDKFAGLSSNGGLTMGYYDATHLPEGLLARQYTMADNFFHAAFGSSMLNHLWLISAATPVWPNPPANLVVKLDAAGDLVKDGPVTPDGYLVNTAYPLAGPHPATITDTQQLVPPLTNPTIGDRLTAKNISWAWFSGGWNDAIAGHPAALFQFNHQPFAYFAAYANGTPGQAAHLKDETDFMTALSGGELPAVSFVKPLGPDNEHPGYASLLEGQNHVAQLVQAVQQSPYWKDTAIIITYDENGGFWDHVAPPAGDRWGPGTRVPLIVVSPFAKRGFVDHTEYDTTSILKLIETRWGLAPLGTRDAAANGLQNVFDYSHPVGQ